MAKKARENTFTGVADPETNRKPCNVGTPEEFYELILKYVKEKGFSKVKDKDGKIVSQRYEIISRAGLTRYLVDKQIISPRSPNYIYELPERYDGVKDLFYQIMEDHNLKGGTRGDLTSSLTTLWLKNRLGKHSYVERVEQNITTNSQTDLENLSQDEIEARLERMKENE